MASLGEVGKVITGNTPKTSEAKNYSSADICFVKPSDISDEAITHLFSSEFYIAEAARDKARMLPPKSILVTCIGIVGKIAVNEVECACNQQINAIVPDTSKCLSEYLCYAIQAQKSHMQTVANAAVVPILNKSQFSELQIFLPSLDQQRHIAAVLDKVSELIALRKQQLAKLDELVKARFVEMFGDVAHDNNKVCLEEISEFVTVGIANSATHAYADSGIVMLRNQNIKENYLDENDLIYITKDFADKYGSKRLAENDILVIRTGYPGVACLVPKKYEGCQTFTTLIVRLKDSSKAYANYVCHYINSSFGKDYVDQSKVGVAQQNFGAKALAKMPIVVPAPTLQDQFAVFVEQTDKSKLAVQQALYKLEMLKKALMQEYFG